MKNNRKIPITRINKFFSQEDFDLEVDFGREWLEGDINIKVILFQVEQGESLTDNIYGEAGRNEIRFKAPVELTVNFKMDAPANKAYSDNAHTIGGFKGFYRTVTCVPTDIDEFNGI